MYNTISLPDRRAIRAALGANVTAWAVAHKHAPAAVHNTIRRYAGHKVDMTQIWGTRTRAILLDLDAAVRAHAPEGTKRHVA